MILDIALDVAVLSREVERFIFCKGSHSGWETLVLRVTEVCADSVVVRSRRFVSVVKVRSLSFMEMESFFPTFFCSCPELPTQ